MTIVCSSSFITKLVHTFNDKAKLLLQLIITGGGNDGIGINGISHSGESLTHRGWRPDIPSLPARIYFHCMVSLNETSVLLIGGASEHSKSSATYVFNQDTNEWTEGPSLKYGRHHHSCARIQESGNSSTYR